MSTPVKDMHMTELRVRIEDGEQPPKRRVRYSRVGACCGQYKRRDGKRFLKCGEASFRGWLAERVGFEPTCQISLTIRFRVGAVMTASVPLRSRHFSRAPRMAPRRDELPPQGETAVSYCFGNPALFTIVP